MENVILIVHLVIAVFLIAVVLLQRSEGGALGIGGGGGGGLVSSRGATSALAKVTWALACAFIATSLTLTVIAATSAGGRSVIEGVPTGVPDADDAPAGPGGFSLPTLPSAPTEPPAAD